jgi:hypothetical protein
MSAGVALRRGGPDPFVTTAEQRVIIGGADLSAQSSAVLRHGAILLAIGLLISVGSFFWKRRASVLVIASSALYLLHLFPFYLIFKYGPAATFRAMWLTGSIPGLRMTALTRDAVLPAAFITAIVLVAREQLFPTVAART